MNAAFVVRRAGRSKIGRMDIGYSAGVADSELLSTTLRRCGRQAPDVEQGLSHRRHLHRPIFVIFACDGEGWIRLEVPDRGFKQ